MRHQPGISALVQRHTMPSIEHVWRAPPPSTSSDDAVSMYRRGVVAFVAGTGDAERYLAGALASDPDFYLAKVAIACRRALFGDAYAPPGGARQLHRWELQHGEIIRAAFTGQSTRANDLRREHLLEFPVDLLIVWLPAASPFPARRWSDVSAASAATPTMSP